jgi:endo-1,4-beta-mannosidase
MDTYFTENDLLRVRGWTSNAIKALLGAPDIATNGKAGNCYLVERVKAGEQTGLYRVETDGVDPANAEIE